MRTDLDSSRRLFALPKPPQPSPTLPSAIRRIDIERVCATQTAHADGALGRTHPAVGGGGDGWFVCAHPLCVVRHRKCSSNTTQHNTARLLLAFDSTSVVGRDICDRMKPRNCRDKHDALDDDDIATVRCAFTTHTQHNSVNLCAVCVTYCLLPLTLGASARNPVTMLYVRLPHKFRTDEIKRGRLPRSASFVARDARVINTVVRSAHESDVRETLPHRDYVCRLQHGRSAGRGSAKGRTEFREPSI